MSEQELRAEIIATALGMNAKRINRGKSGNVSARVGGGLLITPTGVSYEDLRPADIVAMTAAGETQGPLLPSSEWRFHRDVYGVRSDAQAIVHTHSTFATTLACHGRGIPAFHYMIAVAGGSDIRCAPYATFGTQELSDHALAALDGRKACLLGNHGIIAIGASLAGALDLAVEVESLAEQYWCALQLGEPKLLDAAEMSIVIEKFRTYGQQR